MYQSYLYIIFKKEIYMRGVLTNFFFLTDRNVQ